MHNALLERDPGEPEMLSTQKAEAALPITREVYDDVLFQLPGKEP